MPLTFVKATLGRELGARQATDVRGDLLGAGHLIMTVSVWSTARDDTDLGMYESPSARLRIRRSSARTGRIIDKKQEDRRFAALYEEAHKRTISHKLPPKADSGDGSSHGDSPPRP